MRETVTYTSFDGRKTTVNVNDQGDLGLEVENESYDALVSAWKNDGVTVRSAVFDEPAGAWVLASLDDGSISIWLWHDGGGSSEMWLHEAPFYNELQTTCRLCNGSGRVAVGPWGKRPPKVTCSECAGHGLVHVDHQYADATI